MSMIIRNRVPIFAIGILLLSTISFGGYHLAYPPELTTVKLPTVEGCLLQHETCQSSLPGGGKIEFDVSPKTPSPTETLYLTAKFIDNNPDSVRVSFEGETMKMGYLEYDLLQKQQNSNDVQFSGKGGLSICIRGVMNWIVPVNVRIENTIYQVPFKFNTYYNPNSDT